MLVAKEQNLPILFNEGENSQVTPPFDPLRVSLCACECERTGVYSSMRLSGFEKRLCAKHHVDVRGHPHAGRVEHAYFRRRSLSCRQSQTQVGISSCLIYKKKKKWVPAHVADSQNLMRHFRTFTFTRKCWWMKWSISVCGNSFLFDLDLIVTLRRTCWGNRCLKMFAFFWSCLIWKLISSGCIYTTMWFSSTTHKCGRKSWNQILYKINYLQLRL